MDLQRQAYALLTQASEEGRIRFIGNLEAREALSRGDADVLVTDGFTGNICLKAMEGMALTFGQMLKSMLLSGAKTKVAALLLKDGISREMLEKGLSEQQWDEIIDQAQQFSANVCQSVQNSVDQAFAERKRVEMEAALAASSEKKDSVQ